MQSSGMIASVSASLAVAMLVAVVLLVTHL